MNSKQKRCLKAMPLLLLVLVTNSVLADPLVQVTESPIPDVGWQYDFVVFNNFPPGSNLNLYQVAFGFPLAVTKLLLPAGWDQVVIGATTQAFSTNPGAPPIGTDIAPNGSTRHFIFASNQRLVTVPILETFKNVISSQNYTVSGTVSVTVSSGLPDDLNNDGKVDCLDLAIVKASFGLKPSRPGFNPRADANGDGLVDIRDLALVSQKLPAGTKCP